MSTKSQHSRQQVTLRQAQLILGWVTVERYTISVCNQPKVNSAFHPSGVGKSTTGLLAGVKAGRVHLCRVAGITLCDPIWPCSSKTGISSMAITF